MTRPQPRPNAPSGPPRAGFTLVELLVVFVVLSILIALLLPAINGAVRTAKNTAAQANLKQFDQALAAFKAKYGDYPPSRVLLAENGLFPVSSTVVIPGGATGQTDMTVGQLAQRSVGALRKLFPKVTFNTSGSAIWTASSAQWYDFNGDGALQTTPYILQGHECLVFFLGGLPRKTDEGYAMTGFAKNPSNPFTPSIAPAAKPTFVSENREAPLFEFAANRLQDDTINTTNGTEFPGYMDSLGNTLGAGQINFIAYFSAYGNNAYDPNDVNFAEVDDTAATLLNKYKVRFPVFDSSNTQQTAANSPAPNPYTTSTTTAAAVNYVNPQTYQLISSGADGLYGPGGMFKANATGGALPFDATTTTPAAAASIRQREKDNLTNFHGGPLD
jgi:general secretion pathway protein G